MTEQANLNDVSARFARIVGVEPSSNLAPVKSMWLFRIAHKKC
jgi:hypothetical protein